MLHVRSATAADYPAFRRFFGELGLEQAVPDTAYWEAHIAPFTMFLEAEGGDLAAYGLCFPLGARGDVRQIVVDPAWRRQGAGRQILAAVATRLRAAGCRDWRLEVDAENTAAIALYEAVGMRRLHEIRNVIMSAKAVASLAGARSAAWTTTTVQPEEDAELEAHFDYGAGQLMSWRAARPHVPLWVLRDQNHPLGFTRYWRDFQPERALCFPFRAASPDIAAHLLAAATANEEPRELELTVIDPGVADALIAAGAAGAVDHARQYVMGGLL